MRWCIFGSSGQIGSATKSVLREADEVFSPTHSQVDISDQVAVSEYLLDARPDVVLNAAAFTDVDGSEVDVERARLINAKAVGVMSTACQELGAKLIHISTDYVFDGRSPRPYVEFDEIAPLSAYGASKAMGEKLAVTNNPQTWVVRTSWVYQGGFTNFPAAIISKLRRGERVSVVEDQIGAPTYASDVAQALIELASSSAPFGTYHVTNQGQTSWFGFAQVIAETLGFNADLVSPISTESFTRPAKRPLYSVLSNEKWQAAGLKPLSTWQAAWQRGAIGFVEQNSNEG